MSGEQVTTAPITTQHAEPPARLDHARCWTCYPVNGAPWVAVCGMPQTYREMKRIPHTQANADTCVVCVEICPSGCPNLALHPPT